MLAELIRSAMLKAHARGVLSELCKLALRAAACLCILLNSLI